MNAEEDGRNVDQPKRIRVEKETSMASRNQKFVHANTLANGSGINFRIAEHLRCWSGKEWRNQVLQITTFDRKNIADNPQKMPADTSFGARICHPIGVFTPCNDAFNG